MTHRPHCRVCPSEVELTTVLSLGQVPLSNFVAPEAVEGGEPTSPLELGLCPKCLTVQMLWTVDPELLYRKYWYQSGINEAMISELDHVVRSALDRVQPGLTDYVLDIGANDGTLLAHYASICGSMRPLRVGYEPAFNLHGKLQEHCELMKTDFFPPADLTELTAYVTGGFKIITSIAMFYDLDDPNRFVHTCKELLHRDGVWVIQFQDLDGMLKSAAFDNICHEHLQYYSLTALKHVLAYNALEIYDVEHRAINGGSMRVYVGHRKRMPPWATVEGREHVLQQMEREDRSGLLEADATELRFRRFGHRIQEIGRQLRGIIDAHGGHVDAYGASTKGNTLLPVLGLDHTDITKIAERSKDKIGLETIGSRIPIVSEAEWRYNAAEATLVPIWQFREGILRREAEYLKAGGTFIFPLPTVEVVRS